jgi:hypothetical protein
MDSTAGLDTENMDNTAELYSEKSISPQVRFGNSESNSELAKKYAQYCRIRLRNMDSNAEPDSEIWTSL